MQGLAFRAARCCDTQVPRDDKDAGDHNSNQDPGTGGEKYVCDIHSDFPLFDLMGIQNARRTISPGVNSGLSPRPVAVTGEVGKYLCFGGSPFESCSCFLLWKQQEPGRKSRALNLGDIWYRDHYTFIALGSCSGKYQLSCSFHSHW